MGSKRVTEDSVIMYPSGARMRGAQAIDADEIRIYEELPLGYHSLDQDGKILYVNQAWLGILGYGRDEVIGKWFGDFLAEGQADIFKERFSRFKEAGVAEEVEFIMRKGGGGQATVIINGQIIADGGKFRRTSCMMRDISERKAIEWSLRESEERFRIQYQESPLPAFTWQRKGRDFLLVGFNKMAEMASKQRASSFLGKTADELYGERPDIIESIRRCYAERKTVEAEISSMHFFPGRTINATFGYVPPDMVIVYTEDVTDRLRAEEERMWAHKMLAAISDGSTDAIFIKDIQGRYLLFNKEAGRVANRRPDEVVGKDDTFIFPADEARSVMDGDRKVMEGGHVKTYEEVVTTVDGKITYLSTKGPIYDGEGNISGMFGVARDITERKRAEETLKASEEKFQKIFHSNPNPTTLTTVDEGRILDANQAFFEQLGFAREEVVGRTTEDLKVWPSRAARGRFIEKVKADGSVKKMEFEAVKKSGERFNALISAEPITISGVRCLVVSVIDITEQRRMEDELRNNEQRWMRAQEVAKIGNWEYDLATGLVWGSPNAFRIFGLAWDNHGNTMQRLPLEEVEAHIEGSGRVHQALMDLIKENKPYDIEYEIRLQNTGGIVTIMSKAEQVTEGGALVKISGTIQDITERKRAEEILSESEERFRKVFECGPLGMALVDPGTFTFVRVNDSFCGMMGYGGDELRRMTFKDITSPDHVSQDVDGVLRLIRGEIQAYKTEKTYVRKNKDVLWASSTIFTIKNDEGKVKYLLAMVDDITERRRMDKELKTYASNLEEKVAKRTAELENANIEVKKLLQAKTQFVNQISHDLRTPLTPVTTLLPLLAPYMTDETARKRLEVIDRNVGYMRDLVVRTLNLAKLESGSIAFDMKPVALRRLVAQLVADREETWKKGVIISVDVPEGMVVVADALRVREVFENILDNAVKFSSEGGEIRIGARPSNGMAEVSVADDGVGLDAAQLEKVFTEFYKADASRHELSAGLGLPICKRIVERSGGRIWVESEGQGKGTTIRFTLPLQNGVA
jgi:PAS domain S-box-containing protein